MCGGTSPALPETLKNQGLSPRVRGNPPAGQLPRPYRGSIPACAGEPPLPAPGLGVSPVYPRVCGGNRADALDPALLDRSIPACAGEPRPRGISRPRPRVYPRVCGGTVKGLPNHYKLDGLSPRVRGNHEMDTEAEIKEGSIPACAGEPSISGFSTTPGSVYPRVCGGTKLYDETLADADGLSPRVRGNRPRCWLL